MSNKEIKDYSNIEAIVFDMDGTLCLGENILDDADKVLKQLRKKYRCYVLTNNSSDTIEHIKSKSDRLNFDFELNEIFSSLGVTIDWFKNSSFKKVFCLMNQASREIFCSQSGIEHTEKNPEAVLVGFCTEYDYADLNRTYAYLTQDLPYFATNPDMLCPWNDFYRPDCGSLIHFFEGISGRKPIIFGKPEKECADYLLRQIQIPREKILIVGDRLYTDIKIAQLHGMKSCVVLTGETQDRDLLNIDDKPDIILKSVKYLPGFLEIE